MTTVEQSKALNQRRGPFVIVSASGMVTGGRVVHHLANRLGSRRNVVMLVGFQAPGTRGAALAAGADTLRMLGQEYDVRARVVRAPLSSHADRDELTAWLDTATGLQQVMVNHGEPEATAALVASLRRRLDAEVRAARPGGVVALVPS
ncbi:MAG: MBL fold metallo-hydrolase RNA specificity domain-containing protein [Nocardioides sp.]